MLEAKPTIFISHSSKYKDQVARPFRDHIESLGMKAVLVEDMPHPAEAGSEPEAKVEYFLQGSDMFVALLTPDDRVEGGEVRARANIADEIGRAKSMPHLRHRIQVFKAPDVVVHSNINPTREPLDITNPGASFPAFERQAIEWGVMPRSGNDASAAAGPIGPAEGDQPEGNGRDGATEQAGTALAELRERLLDSSQKPLMPLSLAIRRTHIAASNALASLSSGSIYGVHELNGLYRARKELALSSDEVRHLLRSVISRLDIDTAPGWFWLRNASATESHEMLIEFAAADPDTSVRAKSLELLAKTKRPLTPKLVKTLVESGLAADGGQVRSAALELLAEKGDVRLLGQLKPNLEPYSAEAVLEVRARETPSAALRALVTDPYHHNDAIEELLLQKPKRLPATVLRSGLSASFFRTRILCLRGLERSRRLRQSDLDALLADDNGKVRDEALRAAIRNGWKIDQKIADSIIDSSDLDFLATGELQVAYFQTLGRDELERLQKWIGGNGWSVYCALGLAGGEEVAERARADLDSEFSELRTSYQAEVKRAIKGDLLKEKPELASREARALQEELVDRKLREFLNRHENLEPFTLKRFQNSALRILAEIGKPSDAGYARDLLYSDEPDLVLTAIRLLARFGNSDDAISILDASGQLYFGSRAEGVRTAGLLATDKVAIASLMLENDDEAMRLIGVETLKETQSDEANSVLFTLLDDESRSIRAAAIDLLVARLDRTQRRELLDSYPKERSFYFYNVIARVDRDLYAPGWLHSALPSD